MNPEYLVPSMVDQCAAAFNENGSTIQLHRFLKVGIDLSPKFCIFVCQKAREHGREQLHIAVE